VTPILMYHQVAPSAPSAYCRYTVTPPVFARHMRILVALGYRTVSLASLLAARMSGVPLPKRRIVITFDDGFADAVQYATPLLARHGFTATFFVVAGLVGKTSEWTRERRGIEMPLAGTQALRDVAAAGFTVGSHTITHRPLAELDESECRSELRESKRRLEEALQREVRDLAYPYGSTNARVRQAAADCGYQTACSTTEGLSSAADDPLMLRRVHIIGDDSLADFVCRLGTGQAIRNVVQRVRVTRNVSDFAR
jgi:peptidoglycan/xylan/chitin deacetylase (PgdA/CDA1 family)